MGVSLLLRKVKQLLIDGFLNFVQVIKALKVKNIMDVVKRLVWTKT